MAEWTNQRHAEARTWCKGGGIRSREFAAALDEIERLRGETKELRRHNCGAWHDEARGCPICSHAIRCLRGEDLCDAAEHLDGSVMELKVKVERRQAKVSVNGKYDRVVGLA